MANLKSLFAKLTDAAEAARNDVASLRDRRLDLHEQAEAVRTAPLTEAEIRIRVDHVLAAAEADARDWCIFEHLAAATGTTFDIEAAMKHQPLGVASLLLGRQAVGGRLVAEAVNSLPGKPIDATVREAELNRIRAEIDTIEIAEERLVREAEAAGIAIARRADANPAHFLAEDL